jgi:hypothetical protein
MFRSTAPLSDDALALIAKIVTTDARNADDADDADLVKKVAAADYADLVKMQAAAKAASEEAEHLRSTRFEQRVEAKKKQRDQGK